MTVWSKNTRKGRLRLSEELRAPVPPPPPPHPRVSLTLETRGQMFSPGHFSERAPGDKNNCCLYGEIHPKQP